MPQSPKSASNIPRFGEELDKLTKMLPEPNNKILMSDYIGLYRAIQVFTGLCRTIQDCPGLYRTIQVNTGQYRTIQDYTGLYRTI